MSMTVLHVWRLTAVCLLVLALALAGCRSDKTPPPAKPGDQAGASGLPPGVEQLYADAKSDMASGAWDAAIKTLERVEGRAAGTPLAQQAQLDRAYTLYKTGEPAQAIAVLDRFIKLHPASPALDYALYLKGVINFNDNLGVCSPGPRRT